MICCEVYLALDILFRGGLVWELMNDLTEFIHLLAAYNTLPVRSEMYQRFHLFLLSRIRCFEPIPLHLVLMPSRILSRSFSLSFGFGFNTAFNSFLYRHKVGIFALHSDRS